MTTSVFSQIFTQVASGISETYGLDHKAVLEVVEKVLKSTSVQVNTGVGALKEKHQVAKCKDRFDLS